MLKTLRRMNLSGWLCLLACALHLLAPLSHAARHLSHAYDAAGNRTSVKDGLDQETTFQYDGLNRLVSQTFANGDTWTYQYNEVQKIGQLSPRGIYTRYGYDARDRLLEVDAWSTGEGMPAEEDPVPSSGLLLSRNYHYDDAGRLKVVTETPPNSAPSALSPSLAVSYTYDELGRVTSESSHGVTHFYEYDLAGNRVRAQYSTGRVIETSYDGLNRPEVIAEGPRVTQYGYDLAGRAVILVAANGQTSQNGYDALGRLKDRTLFKTPAMNETEVLAQFEWEHDLLGNVTAQHETWPGELTRPQHIRSTVMSYDDNNRLLTETIQTRANGAAAPQDQSETSYTYDAANNRDTKTVTRISGTSSTEAGENDIGFWDYNYNAANQLTGWEKWDTPAGTLQKTATLAYDEAGNRTSQSVLAGGTGSTTSYTWDAQDRLSSVTMPGQPGTANSELRTFTYAYDYRTRRIGTHDVNGTAAKHTAIVFSGGLSVAEWETSGSPPSALSSTPTVEYTRGPDMGGGVGGLLYSQRTSPSSSTPTLRYSLSNGRGDIVAQADSSATLTWTASYEAYGKRTKETGQNLDKQRGNSKDEDPTGLLNEGFRYRDIETGVWLSRDPAGFVDGPNLYAYVMQNPWTAWDPDGLKLRITDTSGKEAVKVMNKLKHKKVTDYKVAAKTDEDGDNYHVNFTSDGPSKSARHQQGDVESEIYAALINSPTEFSFKTSDDLQKHVDARMDTIDAFKEMTAGFKMGTNTNKLQPPLEHMGMGRIGVQGNDPAKLKDAIAGTLYNSKSMLDCSTACALSMRLGMLTAGDMSVRINAGNPQKDGISQRAAPDHDWIPGDWGTVRKLDPALYGRRLQPQNLIYMGNTEWHGHAAPKRVEFSSLRDLQRRILEPTRFFPQTGLP